MVPPMGIPENLKRLRQREGVSQKRLAEKAVVSQQLISQLERGENVSTKKLPDIARALNATVFEIDESYSQDVTGASDPSNWLEALAEAIALAIQSGISLDQIVLTISTLTKLGRDGTSPLDRAEEIREAARGARQLHDRIRSLDSENT